MRTFWFLLDQLPDFATIPPCKMLVPAEERRQEDAVGDEHEKGKAQWVRLPLTAEIEAPVSLS